MKTPFIGFGNDTLDKCPRAKAGDLIDCPTCEKRHKLKEGKDSKGRPSALALFYTCRGEPYLGAINGALIIGRKADCSGEI